MTKRTGNIEVEEGSTNGSTPVAPDPLLSAREVASFLGISRSTLWNWASEGVIPRPMKLGHLSRWRQSTIERVIDKAEAEAQAA